MNKRFTADLANIEPVNLLHLYSATLPDAAEVAKRTLNPKRKGFLISLKDSFTAEFSHADNSAANSVQANWTVQSESISYFEVHIEKGGPFPELAFGLSFEEYDVDEDCPGWKCVSYALHADNGSLYWNEGFRAAYTLRFGEGDTVGVGVISETREIFFTLNGQFIGAPFIITEKDWTHPLFPTVGMCTPGSLVHFNFGQQPFKFDFIVDTIKFTSEDAPLTEVPQMLSQGGFCPVKCDFSWINTDEEALFSYGKDPSLGGSWNIRKTLLSWPAVSNPSTLVGDVDETGLVVIGRTAWAISRSEGEMSVFYPEFTIWEIDLETAHALPHYVSARHLKKPIGVIKQGDLRLSAVGTKIYFFAQAQHASFVFNTADLSIEELNFSTNPTSKLLWFSCGDEIFTASTEYEYPYDAMFFSSIQDGEWADPRYEGPPVRCTELFATANMNNAWYFIGGYDCDHHVPEIDIVTVSRGVPQGNRGLSMLQTQEIAPLADIVLKFGSGEAISAHRAVLSARSGRLAALIGAAPLAGEIEISEPYKTFQFLLEYIYSDALSVPRDIGLARQIAVVADAWLPEHSTRVCEFLALSRVVSPSTMGSNLTSLLESQEFADFQIAVADQTFRVHRAILVARSAYFRAMLLGNLREATASEIRIDDVAPEIFKIVLSFLYGQKTDATAIADSVVDVIIAASRFGVDELIRVLEGVISQNLDAENAQSLLELSERWGFLILAEGCRQYLAKQNASI